MLMENVKLYDVDTYEEHMEMPTSTVNKDIILAKEYQKHLSDTSRKNCVVD